MYRPLEAHRPNGYEARYRQSDNTMPPFASGALLRVGDASKRNCIKSWQDRRFKGANGRTRKLRRQRGFCSAALCIVGAGIVHLAWSEVIQAERCGGDLRCMATLIRHRSSCVKWPPMKQHFQGLHNSCSYVLKPLSDNANCRAITRTLQACMGRRRIPDLLRDTAP
jgi:hypothetical protein